MKRSLPEVVGQVVTLTFKTSSFKKPRFEDPASDIDASEEIYDLEGLSLENLQNPFDVVLRIVSFGTELLEFDRKFTEGGRLQLPKERDEVVAHCEYAKQAFKVVMRMNKKETVARQVAEAEWITTVEPICELSKSLEEAENNFADATKAMGKIEILQ